MEPDPSTKTRRQIGVLDFSQTNPVQLSEATAAFIESLRLELHREYDFDILGINLSDNTEDISNYITSQIQQRQTTSSWAVLVCIIDLDNINVPMTLLLAAIRAYERMMELRPAEAISSFLVSCPGSGTKPLRKLLSRPAPIAYALGFHHCISTTVHPVDTAKLIRASFASQVRHDRFHKRKERDLFHVPPLFSKGNSVNPMQVMEGETLQFPTDMNNDLTELLVTEQTYLRSLILLNAVWLRALRGFSELPDDSKNPFDKNRVKALLTCQNAFEIMIDIHRDMFAAIADTTLQPWPIPRMCRLLQDAMGKLCSSYVQYCLAYTEASEELSRGIDKEQNFDSIRAVFHLIEMQLIGDCNEPCLWLVMPRGRLPRYRLLFEAMERNRRSWNASLGVEELNEDVRAIHELVDAITSACEQVNEALRRAEEAAQTAEQSKEKSAQCTIS